MRILGIDPGLRRTGFGVIDAEGQKTLYAGSGVITPDLAGTEPERLAELFRGMLEVIAHYKPSIAVVERVFVNVNPKSTLTLGQARGVAIAALAHEKLPIDEITPLKIKQSIVGPGRATKEQVQHMVCHRLQLAQAPRVDASDALACALAWWQAQAHAQAVVRASKR